VAEHLLDDGPDVRVIDTVDLAPPVAARADDAGGAQLGQLLAGGGMVAPVSSARVVTSSSSVASGQTGRLEGWPCCAVRAVMTAGAASAITPRARRPMSLV
jgi:hypothetical protein